MLNWSTLNMLLAANGSLVLECWRPHSEIHAIGGFASKLQQL
jgi:hypothetical protein